MDGFEMISFISNLNEKNHKGKIKRKARRDVKKLFILLLYR